VKMLKSSSSGIVTPRSVVIGYQSFRGSLLKR
jgi:hypothetical protein